jgi:hypothetical protein
MSGFNLPWSIPTAFSAKASDDGDPGMALVAELKDVIWCMWPRTV